MQHEATYASFEVQGVEKGIRAWAKARACAIVRHELQQTFSYTQIVLAGKQDWGASLSGPLRVISREVLGGRCQIGDARRFTSSTLSRLTEGCSCPFGCTTADGSKAWFTWLHVAFECRHAEAVGFRRVWRKRLGAVMQLFTKEQGAGFEDLSLLCQRCEQGLQAGGAGGGGVPAVVELSDEDLLLRRAVGGAWSEAKIRRGCACTAHVVHDMHMMLYVLSFVTAVHGVYTSCCGMHMRMRACT